MNTTSDRSTDRDSVLAQLLDEYLASCEAGQPLSADELVNRFPEFAADVGACLASLDFIRHAAQAHRSGPKPELVATGAGLAT